MLNEYDKHMLMAQQMGAVLPPKNCFRIGSYATDYPGVRPDPDTPGMFLHGAVPPDEQQEQPDEEKEADR